jgi:hypothetical protein
MHEVAISVTFDLPLTWSSKFSKLRLVVKINFEVLKYIYNAGNAETSGTTVG